MFDWRYLSPEMTSRGYRVVRMDLPGHGETKRSALKDPDDGSARSMSAYVRNVMEELGTDVLTHAPILVGHSIGTETVVEMATQSLRSKNFNVGGLVLICPIGRRAHRGLTGGIGKTNLSLFLMPILKCFGSFKYRLAKAFSVRAFGFPTRNPGEEYYWMFQRASQIDFNRNASNLDSLSRASFPTLICHGTSDPLMETPIHREMLDGWLSYHNLTSRTQTSETERITFVRDSFRFVTFVRENHYVGLKGSVPRVADHIENWFENRYSRNFENTLTGFRLHLLNRKRDWTLEK